MDRQAIFNFVLLWSLFEGSLLGTNASAKAIIELVRHWAKRGRLDAERFESALEYFRNRYFQDGGWTTHFSSLNLRDNDRPELVSSVLSRQSADATASVASLLIVIYRLRNNLFHG